MTQRLVKETGINLAILRAIRPGGKLGPFPVNHPWGCGRWSGEMWITKTDDKRMQLMLVDPLGGEPIVWSSMRWKMPEMLFDVLSSDSFRVNGRDVNGKGIKSKK